jgi:bifunctional DNA-binding transcriptional regulator/antitoxin component of YhaV-PrlF toxin-antitoxin module
MAKITSKYQVTVPRTIALQYNIHPGDEIDWVAAGDVIRVIPPGKPLVKEDDRELRLRLFDQATQRHRKRSPARNAAPVSNAQRLRDRGWTREDLYGRGRSR